MTTELQDEAAFYDQRWASADISQAKRIRGRAILDVVAGERRHDLSILELGCGTGWLTNELAAYGDCLGVDLSSLAVEQASRTYPNAKFAVVDVGAFHPSSAYDVVVSHEVLEHVRDQANHIRVAFEALKVGGAFVLTTPNAFAAYAAMASVRHHYVPQPIEHWIYRDELEALLRDAGFQIEVLTTIVPSRHYRNRLLRGLASERLERWTDRVGARRAWSRAKGLLGLNEALFAVARKRA